MAQASAGPLSSIILNEIALEGLEGITIPSLWVYLSSALQFPLPLQDNLRNQIWSFILSSDKHLLFYKLPVERPVVKLYNRFDISRLDPCLGVPVSLDDDQYWRYKCVPIQDGDIMGSCEYYKERKEIKSDEIQTFSLEQIEEKWGNKFVIVASQDLRYSVLTPANVTIPKDLTPLQYCIWEAIGRSRFNGETTAGSWSLQHYCKDSTIVFYIKNKLIRFGLVSHQPLTEKRAERFCSSTLLTLPRFFSLHKSVFNSVIEKLAEVLKETPTHRIAFANAKKYFPSLEKQKAFKKIAMTHLFRRIFDVVNIPIKEAEDVIEVNEKSKKDRLILVLQLKDPNISIPNELYAESDAEKQPEETSEFYNEKHTFVDMPIMEEFYRCVERYGSRGCSQSDICHYLAIHHLTIRQFLKKALDDGLITSYFTDVGRQRTNMYVAVRHSETVKTHKDVSMAILKNMKCAEEPPCIPEQSFDVILKDIPSINVKIRNYEYESGNTSRESTLRNVERKALMIKTIDEQGVLPVIEMRAVIQREEKKNGYKDEVCQKSVHRLLSQLCQHGVVRIYEITLQCEEHVRLHRYVTHPKIDADHILLKRETLKLKNRFFMALEERRLREDLHLQKQAKQSNSTTEDSEKKQRKNLIPLAACKSPKLLVSRYLHELLFYMRYILNEQQKPLQITEELLKIWKQAEPNLVISEYLSTFELDSKNANIFPYTEEISWRTFIPPLIKYDEKPHGWLLLIDAVIDRMPLSIFNKIFHLDKCVDERLSEYLAHPVCQHYLIKQLPSDLQCQISRVRLQNTYSTLIKLLNNLGLVQVSLRKDKDPLQQWVYLNRHGQVLDTTSSEAGYSHINPDQSYTPLNYTFRSADDVSNYWTTLHRICVHTKLGFRKEKQRKLGRIPEIAFTNFVEFDEAVERDIEPHVPGDRLGAGGLSSYLFAHAFRHWAWVLRTDSKPKDVPKGRTKRRKIPKILIQNRKSALKSNASKLSVVPLKRLQVRSGAGNLQRSTASSSSKKSSAVRDAIDRDALKNMRTLRVAWRKEEDDVLKMARAVYLYLAAPVVIFNLVMVGKICRDIMRQHLGSYNKTSQACLRRGQFIVKMNRHLPEVPSWLHLLQTNTELQAKYGDNFINHLKKAYPNREDKVNALTVHFVLLLNFLSKLINNNALNGRPQFLIPDSIEEFGKKFKECVPVLEDRNIRHNNPETEFDLQMAIVINVLHSSLCCTRDKTLYNLQAFEIYKHYSEELLNEAFQKARSDGLVVAIKRNNMHVAPSQLTGPAYIFSQKYRFRLMYSKIPYAIYEHFFDFYCGALKTFFGPITSKGSRKQYLELLSPNASQLFFIAEGLANKRWQIDVKLPSNILTVDPEQRQTASPMDRILDHYHCIFDNAPETEYLKQLETEEGEKQVRIKFHPANLSYKVHYSPYDIISKLPTRYLHFFCALDHLQQEVDINFGKLQHQDNEHDVLIMECPFACIMKHANYINAIERIVQENKSVLSELQEMPPQQLLNTATSVSSVTVQPSNLLTLVHMLESFWREKELPLELKDLGKVSTTLKTNKTIDWHQLCKDILEYNCNENEQDRDDEYEPTLNKEERIARAQDVFVVNLPTIQLSVSKELQDSTDTATHEGIEVPKDLIQAALQRHHILQKVTNESFWKYTENTFDTLKPILEERNFTAMEVDHLKDIHDYIQSFKLGVSVLDLLRNFPFEAFLLRALHTLSEHYLIKRVGVSSFMYVHKQHIRPWVVHTFHIKRLEREVLGSTAVTLKRALEHESDDEETQVSSSKKCKLAQQKEKVESVYVEKRMSKPTKRYVSESALPGGKNEVSKEIIVMKPQPWMRLNGSLNRRVFDRWIGSILTECISRCGCMIPDIFLRFPHMFPADIMFLLEILCDLKCIRLRQMQPAKVNLFSEYENLRESDVTEIYNPEDTYVLVESDALTRLAVFIGNKKYKTEFI